MSRRSARRERRNKQRLEKKNKLKQYDDFEKVAGIKSLYNSAKKASKGVKWKASVQRYLLSILFKVSRTRKDLLNNKDIRGGFIEFVINERGKSRNIKSVHFNERVVQKSICLNALYPVLTHNLIYDNCASQKGLGQLLRPYNEGLFVNDLQAAFDHSIYLLIIQQKTQLKK